MGIYVHGNVCNTITRPLTDRNQFRMLAIYIKFIRNIKWSFKWARSRNTFNSNSSSSSLYFQLHSREVASSKNYLFDTKF